LFWDHFNYFESFDVWFGDSPENLEKKDTVSVNYYTVDELEWGERYYWKVVGYKTEKKQLGKSVMEFYSGESSQGTINWHKRI